MQPDGSTPNEGNHQPVTWWVRMRGIPPMMKLVIKDRFGALHTWRVQLVDDFKMFLAKAWSVRLVVLGFFIELGYDLTPALQDAIPLPYYMVIRGIFVVATLLSQILKQGFRE